MKYGFADLLIFPLTQAFWPAVAAFSCGIACFALVFMLAGVKLQRIIPFLMAAIWAMLAQSMVSPMIQNQDDATKATLLIVLGVVILGLLGLFCPKIFYAMLAAILACKIALLPALPGAREIPLDPKGVPVEVRVDQATVKLQLPEPAQWAVGIWKITGQKTTSQQGREELIGMLRENTILLCAVAVLIFLLGIVASRFIIAMLTTMFGLMIAAYAATIYFAGRDGIVGPANWNQLIVIGAIAAALLIGFTLIQMKLFKAPPAKPKQPSQGDKSPEKGA